MKVEITKAQLQSITDLANDAESMLGNGGGDTIEVNGKEVDSDAFWRKHIKNIDNFLIKNGFNR